MNWFRNLKLKVRTPYDGKLLFRTCICGYMILVSLYVVDTVCCARGAQGLQYAVSFPSAEIQGIHPSSLGYKLLMTLRPWCQYFDYYTEPDMYYMHYIFSLGTWTPFFSIVTTRRDAFFHIITNRKYFTYIRDGLFYITHKQQKD